MMALRSALYNAYFFIWTGIILLTLWVLLPFPRAVMQRGLRVWALLLSKGLYFICGTSFEVRGRQYIPAGGAVLASKHQSAWDTFIFYLIANDPAYIMKKELMSIPFWGWYAKKAQAVSVDRSAGARALRDMTDSSVRALRQGREVIIFPEGTRSAPDQPGRYHPGVAALYKQADEIGVPVVPVAVNSGVFWPRRSFLKRPGKIIIEFLPPIATGLERRAFMTALQTTVDDASAKLVAEARANYAHALPAP